VHERLQTGMTTYSVSTTGEAIALAERLRDEGTYQWFRGQTRDWPLRSSLQRRSGTQQESAVQWLIRFRGWLSHAKGLWPIAADSDQSTAVAQHYGIATDFVDFTVDPTIAAFFATHEPDKTAVDRPGVIICLNVDHLRKFWAERYEGFRSPDLVELSVPNLWRLESQRGAFLFCPYMDFEQFYPLDRILFPRSLPTRLPTLEQIYPSNKSALEILLDQFFMNRAISEWNEEAKSVIPHTIKLSEKPDRYDPDCFIAGTLDLLASWAPTSIQDWIAVPHERYDSTVRDEVLHVSVPRTPDLARTISDVRKAMRLVLEQRPELRQQAIRFAVDAPEYSAPKAVEDLDRLLPRLWDGLRALPYTNDEIALACANCIAIRLGTLAHLVSASDEPEPWEEKPAIQLTLGANFLVEFGQDDGSYSRAYVRDETLRALVRPDLDDLVKPEFRSVFRDSLENLLLKVHAPERLLDFRGLAHLFATELVPIQLLMRRTVIVFTPARLETFGLR
jgi:hypothetical protein